jgi:hypothetical protein
LAFTDIFVSWFPALFGGSLILSAIVFEACQRGHLKSNWEPGKRGAVGLLLLLGFNFVVFVPIGFLLLLSSLVGTSSLIEAALAALMSLYYIIPSVLSGVVGYSIIRGLFNGWGVGVTGIVVSITPFALALLDRTGLLPVVSPWIMDAVIHLVGFGFGYVLLMVIFGVCLSKVVPHSDEESTGKDKNGTSSRRQVSQTSALSVVLGLGRRIAIDESEDALHALRRVIEYGPPVQPMVLNAGRTAGVNLKDALATKDTHHAQQQLQMLKKRFGRFSRRTRDAFIALSVISLVSGAIAVYSFVFRFVAGIVFLFPAVLIPVLLLVLYHETSRFGPDRYFPPLVNLRNSYLLTEAEFKRKSQTDTLRVATSFALLAAVVGYGLVRPAPEVLWILVAGTALVLLAVLSSMDRSLKSERLNPTEIETRTLEYLGIEDDEPETPAIEKDADLWASWRSTEEMVSSSTTDTGWKQELEMRGHSEFAERVEKGTREAYSEHTTSYCYMGGGGMFMFMAVFTGVLFSSLPFLGGIQYFSLVIGVIGTPVFLYGTIQYMRARPSSRFHGLNRRHLTSLLSLLDIEAEGVGEIGSIADRAAPSEYQTFGMTRLLGVLVTRAAVVALGNRIPWPEETYEAVRKTRSSYPKMEAIALTVTSVISVLLYFFFVRVEIQYMPFVLRLMFFGITVFVALTAVWSIRVYYREKRAISCLDPPSPSTKSLDTLNVLMDLLLREFRKPLRLLVIGDYDQLEYTGKSYFTTRGVELREAILVPEV